MPSPAQPSRTYTMPVLIGLVFFTPFFADFFLYFTDTQKEAALQPPLPTQHLPINDEQGRPTHFKKGRYQLIYIALNCTQECKTDLAQMQTLQTHNTAPYSDLSLGLITSKENIASLSTSFKNTYPSIALFSIDPLALKHFFKNANLKGNEKTAHFWILSPHNYLMRQYAKIKKIDEITSDLIRLQGGNA
jgi:hypothetical protein